MTEDADEVTTDHDRIRTAAEARGVVPVRVEQGGGSGDGADDEAADLALVATPRERGERVSWPAFFDRLDEAGLAVRIRRGEEDPRELDVLSQRRDPADGEGDGHASGDAGERTADRAAEKTTDPETTDSNQLATSDTGDDEPVVFDRTEADAASADTDDPSTAPAGDSARGPADALVLDEIHEHSLSPGADDREGEYVVFENESEATLDLSGWTVANEAGATYRFPAGVALASGDRLTLHSGAGEDGDGELYWHADGPVWGNQGDTVIVETDAGERVLEQPYEGGR